MFDKLYNSKYDFVKKAKYYIFGSLAVLFVGLIFLFVHGFNLSIDFTGGTVVNIKAGEAIENTQTYNEYVDRANDVLKEKGLKVAYSQKEGTGESATLQIRYQDIAGKSVEEMNDLTKEVVQALGEVFVDEHGDSIVDSGTRITATASSRLVLNALLAISIASILIVVYLAIRFKQVKFGICSIIGLLHDVLITCAFMLIFNLEVGSVFVAALITVVGYSINNNVVIFDRMRENVTRYPNLTTNELTNKSVSQSLTRTIITTLTTLVVVIVIAIIGIASIRLFTLPIIVGIAAGLYSSIFIVTPLFAMMSKGEKIKFKERTKWKIQKDTTEMVKASDNNSNSDDEVIA